MCVRRQDVTSMVADLIILKSANKRTERRFVIRRWQPAAGPPGRSWFQGWVPHWVDAPSAGSGEIRQHVAYGRVRTHGSSPVPGSWASRAMRSTPQVWRGCTAPPGQSHLQRVSRFSAPRQSGRARRGCVQRVSEHLQAVSRAMAGAKILTPPAHRIWRELDGGEELRNMQNRDTAYGTANSAFLRRAIFV